MLSCVHWERKGRELLAEFQYPYTTDMMVILLSWPSSIVAFDTMASLFYV